MDLAKITRETGKTYSFDNNHDRKRPAQYWFQNPVEGLTLFIVLYTMACRWSQCLGCNLPSKMSEHHVPFSDIMGQVDYVFDELISADQKRDMKKIILSNNGSVLDEDTFSTTALLYFIAKMNLHCPNVSTLTMETRPEYIDWEELEIIARTLREGDTPTGLEIAIGFEAFDDVVRNEHFHKGMSLAVFENMVNKLAKYGFSLKTYFMLKPVPEMTEEDAIQDIINAIDYLDRIASRYSIDINMHLNPTYVAYGTPLETAFKNGTYQSPHLESVVSIVKYSEGKKLSLFVGLDDEGLAVEGGSFIRQGDQVLVKKLEEFNHLQDCSVL